LKGWSDSSELLKQKDTSEEKGQARDTRLHVTLECIKFDQPYLALAPAFVVVCREVRRKQTFWNVLLKN